MKKVLVYNCMKYPDKIRLFRQGIEREVKAVGIDAVFFTPLDPGIFEDFLSCSHLIISGSEASAMAEKLWTDELTRLIREFEVCDKKILGICYGHQFLARVLGGIECVCRLPVAEYGYSKVILSKNSLFRNIENPVCLQLHHDAVRNLGDDFEIIASNSTCIQAFQYRQRDIFGVQFHPEFDIESAKYFFEVAAQSDPGFYGYFKNETDDLQILEQNRLFIQNFLKM
jgi:GMP synthase-like glutamine amidotransferase